MTIDTQTSQLLAHLRRGGNYSYFWAASQAKDSQGDALWKCTYWHNGSGPAELPADEHTQYGSVHLYFGVHPTKLLPKERLRDGKLKPIHPGNARAIIEEIAAVNCLFGDFDALGRLAKARCERYSTWIAVGQALAELGDAGRALWIEWSKGSDKFDEDVCTAKWATFRADPKRLTLGSLFYWANEDDPQGSDDPRPAIDISTLDLPTVMPQAWDAIVASNNPPTLFRRAGELARLETTETDALMVKTVDPRRMAGILARAARWVRVSYDRKGNATEKETIPPTAVVDDCMVNIDPRIPPITRVVHAPTFAAGDVLLTTPGYHPAARIYYDPRAGAVVPDVPNEPTTDDLERTRALVLDDLLADFPFVSEADRAHAVALFLLPFVRELISGPTPLHLIEAPTMGSGKGLLADALLLPALGDTPTPMAEATNDEEWRKRITSALLGAPAVIYIDNSQPHAGRQGAGRCAHNNRVFRSGARQV
ncbi:MAG TPA: PriCT-2 domain-containing protein [Roseiflexaceae bacterium]|nr:PriCT-2 domain-containing protein [Roseiflexaceae bacterium]